MVATRIAAMALVIAVTVQGQTAGEERAPVLEIINVPGFLNAQGHGISPTGTISGNHQGPGLGNHGFTFDGSEYTTLDVPGWATFYLRTSPTGDAVATVGAPGAGRRGFFFNHSTGEFSSIDGPAGATNVTPWGLNAQGDIVGSYMNPTPRAFLLTSGVFTDLTVPGATGSAALDINAPGDIVGRFMVGSLRRMFLRTRHGDYYTIEVPGAISTGLVGEPGGINDKQEIVGPFQDGQSLKVKGFLLDADGFHVLDFPNTDFVIPADIDNHGNIVGTLRITGSGRNSAFVLWR